MDSVSNQLRRVGMQNRPQSISASPTVEEWRNKHENTPSRHNDIPAGRELSWRGWAGELKKNQKSSADNPGPRDAARISWHAEGSERERVSNAGSRGTSRERLGYSDNDRTGRIGELAGSNTDAAWHAGNKAGQSHLSESRIRGPNTHAAGFQANNGWDHASHRGSVEANVITWGGEAEQSERDEYRSWGHKKRNSPVVAQRREHRRSRGQSQANATENVEW